VRGAENRAEVPAAAKQFRARPQTPTLSSAGPPPARARPYMLLVRKKLPPGNNPYPQHYPRFR
jgi:hypothetical protein